MYANLASFIRDSQGSKPSAEDQVRLAKWLFEQELTESNNRYARTNEIQSAIGDVLQYTVKTALENLRAIGVVKRKRPQGSDHFILHERSGEYLFDIDANRISKLLEPDLERFIEDVQDQDQLDDQFNPRRVAADALNIRREELEEHLRSPEDPIERMERYDRAVAAIKDNPDTSRKRDYDRMGWRNKAIRWTLSKVACQIEMNEALPVD